MPTTEQYVRPSARDEVARYQAYHSLLYGDRASEYERAFESLFRAGFDPRRVDATDADVAQLLSAEHDAPTGPRDGLTVYRKKSDDLNAMLRDHGQNRWFIVPPRYCSVLGAHPIRKALTVLDAYDPGASGLVVPVYPQYGGDAEEHHFLLEPFTYRMSFTVDTSDGLPGLSAHLVKEALSGGYLRALMWQILHGDGSVFHGITDKASDVRRVGNYKEFSVPMDSDATVLTTHRNYWNHGLGHSEPSPFGRAVWHGHDVHTVGSLLDDMDEPGGCHAVIGRFWRYALAEDKHVLMTGFRDGDQWRVFLKVLAAGMLLDPDSFCVLSVSK